MDDHATYARQLHQDDGPVVLINQFNLAPGDTERFLQAWADDAAFMKQQPGFISTQLHRGTAGSTTFWQSPRTVETSVVVILRGVADLLVPAGRAGQGSSLPASPWPRGRRGLRGQGRPAGPSRAAMPRR